MNRYGRLLWRDTLPIAGRCRYLPPVSSSLAISAATEYFAQRLGPCVIKVRQHALLDCLRRLLVAGNRTLRVAGDRFVDPVDPFQRVEPSVAQLDEPSGFQGYVNFRDLAVPGSIDVERFVPSRNDQLSCNRLCRIPNVVLSSQDRPVDAGPSPPRASPFRGPGVMDGHNRPPRDLHSYLYLWEHRVASQCNPLNCRAAPAPRRTLLQATGSGACDSWNPGRSQDAACLTLECSNLKRTDPWPTCLKRLRVPSPMGFGSTKTRQRSGEKTNGT